MSMSDARIKEILEEVYDNSDDTLKTKATSSALPTGAATSAKQDVGNASIASVDTKLGEVQATPTLNTVLGRLKDLLTGIVLAAGTNLIGKVSIDQVTANANEVVTKTGSVTNATLSAETTKVIGTVNDKVADGDNVSLGAKADAAATVGDTTPFSVIALLKGIYNKLGATILAAGSAIIGQVGIDQTTDGTTNKVSATQSTHNNLNCNANIQVGDADVSISNAVPTKANFKTQNYIIPVFQVGGAAFTNQPANDGVEVVSNSASDVQKCTIWGTTFGTGALVSETITLNGVTEVATTKTDWDTIHGVFLGEEDGTESIPAVGTITIREASADQTITTIAATKRSIGTQIFTLTAKNIIVHNISGNTYENLVAFPTTNNAFQLTAGMVKENQVATHLYLLGDTTGSTAQVEVLGD